jgi:hypothetical protein
MHGKPCRIAKTTGNLLGNIFRRKFRRFRLTTPTKTYQPGCRGSSRQRTSRSGLPKNGVWKTPLLLDSALLHKLMENYFLTKNCAQLAMFMFSRHRYIYYAQLLSKIMIYAETPLQNQISSNSMHLAGFYDVHLDNSVILDVSVCFFRLRFALRKISFSIQFFKKIT